MPSESVLKLDVEVVLLINVDDDTILFCDINADIVLFRVAVDD